MQQAGDEGVSVRAARPGGGESRRRRGQARQSSARYVARVCQGQGSEASSRLLAAASRQAELRRTQPLLRCARSHCQAPRPQRTRQRPGVVLGQSLAELVQAWPSCCRGCRACQRGEALEGAVLSVCAGKRRPTRSTRHCPRPRLELRMSGVHYPARGLVWFSEEGAALRIAHGIACARCVNTAVFFGGGLRVSLQRTVGCAGRGRRPIGYACGPARVRVG
jgi:hypothetical protein